MTVSELRIGVIGVGGRGELAGHAQQPEQGSRIVAGADVSPKALADFQQRYGAQAFATADYRELLARSDVDAVFVTSPDFCHEEHALAALNAGKHVYLEKPMAITIDGCDRLLRAARQRGVKLYLGHNMRHMAVVRKMKQLIDAGAIGNVKAAWCRHFVSYGGDAYYKDWHAERAKSTGLLLQKGAHDIDVLHWLCRGYSRTVTAFGTLAVYGDVADRDASRRTGTVSWQPTEIWPPRAQKGLNPAADVEDLSMVLMQLDSGVLASYQQCHFAPDAWRNYTFIGDEGRLENFGDDPGHCVIRVWNRREDRYNPYGAEQHYIPREGGTHGGADPKIVAEFVRYVRQGGTIATSAVAGRYAVAAGCCATESLRNNGKPCDVPPLPNDLAKYFQADVADTV